MLIIIVSLMSSSANSTQQSSPESSSPKNFATALPSPHTELPQQNLADTAVHITDRIRQLSEVETADPSISPGEVSPVKTLGQNMTAQQKGKLKDITNEIAPPSDNEFSLYVSKLDAGVAILMTDDHHIIEFPSILLPESTKSGSMVRITAVRDELLEQKRLQDFIQLQDEILKELVI